MAFGSTFSSTRSTPTTRPRPSLPQVSAKCLRVQASGAITNASEQSLCRLNARWAWQTDLSLGTSARSGAPVSFGSDALTFYVAQHEGGLCKLNVTVSNRKLVELVTTLKASQPSATPSKYNIPSDFEAPAPEVWRGGWQTVLKWCCSAETLCLECACWAVVSVQKYAVILAWLGGILPTWAPLPLEPACRTYATNLTR